jgi:hypothetical protein
MVGIMYKARCNTSDGDRAYRNPRNLNIMSRLIANIQSVLLIGIVIEGFFYGEILCCVIIASKWAKWHDLCGPGLYAAIFYLYIQHHMSREGIHMTRNILLYPLCVLSILSTAIFVLDITRIMVVLEVSKIYIHSNKFSVPFTLHVGLQLQQVGFESQHTSISSITPL